MSGIRIKKLRHRFQCETPSEERVYGNFQSSASSTFEKLEYELSRLHVDSAVIEVDADKRTVEELDYDYDAFRGFYMSGFKSPKVCLKFTHPEQGVLVYPCDTYQKPLHNIRGIALTLEAQRAIERYGAAKGGQQYRGWQELPGSTTEEEEIQIEDAVEAAEYVATHSGYGEEESDAILTSKHYFSICYKKAAMKLHPDTGGNPLKFKALQVAKELMEQHFQAA